MFMRFKWWYRNNWSSNIDNMNVCTCLSIHSLLTSLRCSAGVLISQISWSNVFCLYKFDVSSKCARSADDFNNSCDTIPFSASVISKLLAMKCLRSSFVRTRFHFAIGSGTFELFSNASKHVVVIYTYFGIFDGELLLLLNTRCIYNIDCIIHQWKCWRFTSYIMFMSTFTNRISCYKKWNYWKL